MNLNGQIRILSYQDNDERMKDFLKKWNIPEEEWESMIESAKKRHSDEEEAELESESDKVSFVAVKKENKPKEPKKKSVSSVSELDESYFFQHRIAIPFFVRCMLFSAQRSKFDYSMMNFSLSRALVKLVVEHVKNCDKEVYEYFLPYINKYFETKK